MLYPKITGNEEGLALLMAAHRMAARQNLNASSELAAAMGKAGVGLKEAFTAALAVTGGHHAPVSLIRHFIFDVVNSERIVSEVCRRLSVKAVPGWGNSFHKGAPDPACKEVAQWVESTHPAMHSILSAVTAICHDSGKLLFPNIGAYTAVIAEILGMPRGTELLLFALPRLEIWTEHYVNARG